MKFEIIKEETKDHWLELKGSSGAKILEGKKWRDLWDIHVVCKWDGCMDYRSYSNGYEWDHECKDGCQCLEDYIHICEAEEFIKQVQEIKKIAIDHFKNGEWE